MLISSLRLITDFVNFLHDKLIALTRLFGLQFSDKQLHFWVIGLMGIVFFLLVNKIFEQIARYSITIISFIYTFTVLVVVVFAIEIEQKITGHGNMEFLDIVEGLKGFLLAFSIYLTARILSLGIKKAVYRLK